MPHLSKRHYQITFVHFHHKIFVSSYNNKFFSYNQEILNTLYGCNINDFNIPLTDRSKRLTQLVTESIHRKHLYLNLLTSINSFLYNNNNVCGKGRIHSVLTVC